MDTLIWICLSQFDTDLLILDELKLERWKNERWKIREMENKRDGGDSVRQGKLSETESRDSKKMRFHGIRNGKIKRSAGELERRDGRSNI